MTKWQVEQVFLDCQERLGWQLRHLQARNREWEKAKQPQKTAQANQSRSERAFTYVFLAGVLEDLFRSLDTDLPQDLNQVTVMRHNLRPQAMALLVPQAWDSISSDRVIRLAKRSALIETANNFYQPQTPIDFSQMQHLGITDGRTVNTQHFEALWDGLCLDISGGSIWESPLHRQAIQTLASKRNTIAHFETDPRVEAFRSSYGELAILTERITAVATRLQEHLVLWLDKHKI
ncbi:hypothetical protein [Frigoribacterium sp. PhB107]|uniref:hypothetical protein n=1 Tax=Frigoribacterium sp. PhB107 TaxID=2485172 RepID=UPI0011CEC08D|nr:hypothetical protein [Frigoribacterium sp. PhB107]